MPEHNKIDFTIFKYISSDVLQEALINAGFSSIELLRSGNSANYMCFKGKP
jgi:hypothetical protein